MYGVSTPVVGKVWCEKGEVETELLSTQSPTNYYWRRYIIIINQKYMETNRREKKILKMVQKFEKNFTPSVTESEEKKLKCLERDGEDCEEDIYGNCYYCGRYMLPTQSDKLDLVGEFIRDVCSVVPKSKSEVRERLNKILSSNTERVKKAIKEERNNLGCGYNGCFEETDRVIDRIISKL